MQKELPEVFFNYINYSELPCPSPKSTHHGLRELIETPEEEHVEDVLKPETGRVRLELR